MTLCGAASSKSLANEEGVHNWNYSSKLRLRSEPTKETQTTSAFAILTLEENIHECVDTILLDGKTRNPNPSNSLSKWFNYPNSILEILAMSSKHCLQLIIFFVKFFKYPWKNPNTLNYPILRGLSQIFSDTSCK